MPANLETLHENALHFIHEFKEWGGADSIKWQLRSERHYPRHYHSKTPLLVNGSFHEGLYLELHYKPSILSGVKPAFSVSLMLRGVRLLGLDAGRASSHLNLAGAAEEHYQQTIHHPHLHRAVADSISGYAEPLPDSELEDLWEDFLLHASLNDAPALNLPEQEQIGSLL